MQRVLKIIWRLDFPASYAYIDKRGSALRLLTQTVEDFWDEAGEGAEHMSFVGRSTKGGGLRTLSIAPTNMNGALEWPDSIELDRVTEHEGFRGSNSIVKELLKLFEIKKVVRAGIRCFCLTNFSDGKRDAHTRFTKHLGEANVSSARATLGGINDLALILEGQTDDKINYRAQFGPYENKNAIAVLEKKPDEKQLELLSTNDLFFDIDLYEKDISFFELNLYRWAQTKIAKADGFIKSVRKEYN